MRSLAALLAAGAIVVLLFWFVQAPEDASSTSTGTEAPSAEEVAPKSDAPALAETREQVVPTPEEATDDRAVYRGRCVDEDGRPLSGVTIQLRAWSGDDAETAAYAKEHGPITWQDPKPLQSGEDGRFELRTDPPPPPYVTLVRLDAPRRLPMQARWSGSESGGGKDFGDVVLVRGCEVFGTVLDDLEQPQAGVSVRLSRTDRRYRGAAGQMAPQRPQSVRTGADGVFRMRTPLLSGKWRVSVSRERLLEPKLLAIAETDLRRELRIKVKNKASIPTIRGVVVDAAGNPVRGAKVTLDAGYRGFLSKPDGTFSIEKPEREDRELVHVRARKDGFEHATTKEPIEFGTEELRLVLRRATAMTVAVTDAATRAPVEDFVVRLITRGRKWTFTSGQDEGIRGKPPHEKGELRVDGMRRGEYSLRVESTTKRFVPSRFLDIDVGEGHPSRIEVALAAPVRRTVRVVDSADQPVAGADVELLEPLLRPVTLETTATKRFDEYVDRHGNLARACTTGTTDARGELDVAGPGARELAVRVRAKGFVPRVEGGVFLDRGEGPIVVVIQSGATISGRIGPRRLLTQMANASVGGGTREAVAAALRLHPRQNPRGGALPAAGRKGFAIAKDGTFRITGIPPGDWRLVLGYWRAINASTRTSQRLLIQQLHGLKDGEHRKLTLDLDHLVFATVRCRITLNGKPYVGGVSLEIVGPARQYVPARTGDDGELSTEVPPGTYRISLNTAIANRAVHLITAESLVARSGGTVAKDIAVTSREFAVRILGSDGEPVPNLRVQARTASGRDVWLRPCSKTGVTKTWLTPGRYHLHVWPKALKGAAMRRFEAEHKDDPDALRRAYVPVAEIEVGATGAMPTVRLPAASGY